MLPAMQCLREDPGHLRVKQILLRISGALDRGILTPEQEGQIIVCWFKRSRASLLGIRAGALVPGKGPPPPIVSTHFLISASILHNPGI